MITIDDNRLIDAVERCNSWGEVCNDLGLSLNSYWRGRLKLRSIELGLIVSYTKVGGRERRWSEDNLVVAVAACHTWSQVCTHLGLSPHGGNSSGIKNKAIELGLDSSHFILGNSKPWIEDSLCEICETVIDPRRRFCSRDCNLRYRKNLDLEYIERWKLGEETGSTDLSFTASVVVRWIWDKEGPHCWQYGWDTPHESDGLPPLQIDHINGDRSDDSFGNLRLLCPNCHALTPTWGARDRTRLHVRDENEALDAEWKQ